MGGGLGSALVKETRLEGSALGSVAGAARAGAVGKGLELAAAAFDRREDKGIFFLQNKDLRQKTSKQKENASYTSLGAVGSFASVD